MRFTDPEFRTLLFDAGVPVGRRLGHGAYGVVFEHLTDRERVIKATTGANEAQTALWLYRHTSMGTSPHACLPAVHAASATPSTFKLSGYRGRGDFWVYEREALDDWRVYSKEMLWGQPCRDRPCLDGYYRAWGAVFDATEHSTYPEIAPNHTARALIGQDFAQFVGWVGRIYSRDHVAQQRAVAAYRQVFHEGAADIRRMLDFAEWALDKQIRLTDLHRENWGQRANGEKVVRDIGGIRLPPTP